MATNAEGQSAYRLTWEDGASFILTSDKAARVVASWTGRGLLVGSLEDGEVRFEDNFGHKATLRTER